MRASPVFHAADHMRVLIVEDDASLAAGLSGILENEGLAVGVSNDGDDALRAAAAPCDLMILDIGLPALDGFGVLEKLRNSGRRFPVLILTARDAVGDRVRGLNLGADDYMAKPFAMPELTARVRALLRRSQTRAGRRIVYGPLLMDFMARRVFLRGLPLELLPREWAVLEALLANVEKIVSKERIIDSIVGWETELSVNAIEAYISRLRAKLEPAGIRIRTVRGFGYMLEEFKVDSQTSPTGDA